MTTSLHCPTKDWPVSRSLCTAIALDALRVRGSLKQFDDWLATHGVRSDEAEIVLAEVLNNLVEHGQGPAAGDIHLCARLDGDQLYCEIHDKGPAFAPPVRRVDMADHSSTPIDTLPEGGFGLFLIQSLCEEIDYQSECGCNRLSLKIPLITKSEQI